MPRVASIPEEVHILKPELFGIKAAPDPFEKLLVFGVLDDLANDSRLGSVGEVQLIEQYLIAIPSISHELVVADDLGVHLVNRVPVKVAVTVRCRDELIRRR